MRLFFGLLLFSLISLILLSGCCGTVEKAKTTATNGPIATTGRLSCPEKGFAQSDVDYCYDLCMLGKSDAGIHQDLCTKYCEQADYLGGTTAVQREIQEDKCTKCGICTPEQLAEIQKKKQDEERQQNISICNGKCYNDTLKVKDCKCTSGDGSTTYCSSSDKCIQYLNSCWETCENGTYVPYENSEMKKADDHENAIEIQKANDMENAIAEQSKLHNGYIYIENIYGAGLVAGGYEFPYPAKEPTKVPVELGRQLLKQETYYRLVQK